MNQPAPFAVWHGTDTPIDIFEATPRNAAMAYAAHYADMQSGDVELVCVRGRDGVLTRWVIAADISYTARMLHEGPPR